MDPRSSKPRDFVAVTKNMTEDVRKTKLLQMKWLQKYEWLLDEHVKLQQEIQRLEKERTAESSVDDCRSTTVDSTRTCLPAPITTSDEYGWLAKKPEFRLEKYGQLVVKYADPLKDITPLPGNIPSLSAGKGFIR